MTGEPLVLMDRAGCEGAHLAGNSLGGWIALEVTARAPSPAGAAG